MKKLLAILGAVGLTATASVAVVSCSGDKENYKKDENGRVILNFVKGIKLELAEIGNATSGNIAEKFYESNEAKLKEVLGDTITKDMLYVTSVSRTGAKITGKNKNQTLITDSTDDAVTVTFTSKTDSRTNLKTLLTEKKIVTENLLVDKTAYETTETYSKQNAIADALINKNVNALPKGVTNRDFYTNTSWINEPTANALGKTKVEGSTSSNTMLSGEDAQVDVIFKLVDFKSLSIISNAFKNTKLSNDTKESYILKVINDQEGLEKVAINTDITITITKATADKDGSIVVKAKSGSEIVKGSVTLVIPKLSSSESKDLTKLGLTLAVSVANGSNEDAILDAVIAANNTIELVKADLLVVKGGTAEAPTYTLKSAEGKTTYTGEVTLAVTFTDADKAITIADVKTAVSEVTGKIV